MTKMKIEEIVVHIIDPSGKDHYVRFYNPEEAYAFVNAMRSMQIPAENV